MAMRERVQTPPHSEVKRVKPDWMPWVIVIAAMIMTGITPSEVQVASGAVGTVHVGSPAPDFTLLLLNGKTVTLSGLKGKPILLSFWHSG